MMSSTKFDVVKFDGTRDFALWKIKMKALLTQYKCESVLLATKPTGVADTTWDEMLKTDIDTAISNEDQALLLLTSLPSSYDNFMKTLLYGRATSKLEDVLAILNSKELQKMTEAKGDGGERFYVRGRSSQIDIEQGKDSVWSKSQGRSSRLRCYICHFEEHLKRDCPTYNHKKSQGLIKNKDQVSSYGVDSIRYVLELRRNLISLGTLKKESFTVKMQSGKIKVIKDSLVVLSRTRRANCIYTQDGQAVTRKTLKGRKQLGEYQTGWKIKTGNVLDFCNQRSTQQCAKSGVTKHLGVAVLQQQNGLVKETNVTLLAKMIWMLSQMCMCLATVAGNAMTTAMAITESIHQSGNALRVSQSWFYNRKLVQTLLDEHSILSLGGSLSGDWDVEKNDRRTGFLWIFNYAIGRSITVMGRSITRYGLMIKGCAGSLEVMMLHMMALSPTEAGYMTLTEAVNEASWINGLLTESRANLMSATIFLLLVSCKRQSLFRGSSNG
nr:zinc finger, CCHC-type [Tanacetum cinerariifolium]